MNKKEFAYFISKMLENSDQEKEQESRQELEQNDYSKSLSNIVERLDRVNYNLVEINKTFSNEVKVANKTKIGQYAIAILMAVGFILSAFGIVITNEWNLLIGGGVTIVIISLLMILFRETN